MKKRTVMMFLALTLTTAVLPGCGRNQNNNNNNNNNQNLTAEESTENTRNENVPLEDMVEPQSGTGYAENANNGDTENVNTENAATSQLQLGYAVEIPKGFEKVLPEAAPNQMVEKVITQYYNIPQNQYEKLGYYYNYVDLNGDSVNEILAFILEIDKDWNEADEIDEETLLWISIEDENVISDAVKQVFPDAEAPVYISHHMTEGYRDLILREDEDEYHLLVWNGERYQMENEGRELPNLNGYEGQAVLTMEGNYHVLGAAQQQ